MTDRNLPPTSIDDHDDSADARWFRTAVAPVVDAEPVTDAWDDIRGRATGEAPTIVRLEPAASPARGPRRRMALVAAAVIAVAGIGGAVAVTRDGGDGPAETVVATPTDEEATGWYIPQDLPDGWALESVETDWLDVADEQPGVCPCDATAWVDGQRTIVIASATSAGPGMSEGGSEEIDVDLGDGVMGRAWSMGPLQVLRWELEGRPTTLVARDVDQDDLRAAAMALVADVDSSDPPLPGFQKYLTRSMPGGIRAYHSVTVRLTNPDGDRTMAYTLSPEGYVAGFIFAGSPTQVEVTGQRLPLDRIRTDLIPVDPTASPGYIGRWPGADVVLGEASEPSTGPVTDADVQSLIASLRPATGDDWRAFLDTATGNVEDDARTDRLSDLIVYEGDETDPEADDDPDVDADQAIPSDDTTFSNDGSTDDSADDSAVAPTTIPDLPTTAAMNAAGRFADLAPGLADRSEAVPDDLFAETVRIGLGPDVYRTVSSRNLAGTEAWVIDEDDGVTSYQAWAPPFSALALITEATEAGVDLVVSPYGPSGCAGVQPQQPTPEGDEAIVTIMPMNPGSCIEWFEVAVVFDPATSRITAVHVYLWEP